MNLQSLLLLAVILAAAAVALYIRWRNSRRGGGCATCNCGDCPRRGSGCE